MRRWAPAVAALALILPGAAPAQDPIAVPSPILTIDQERLFEETRLGLRSTRAIDAAAEALTEENRRIEEELRAEEVALTERRASMSAEEFAGLADAFDTKVQEIRAEQDAKARALADRQEEARQAFFIEVAEILSEIVREEGAVVILDRRDVFLSADRIDITDRAIARINAAAGETPDAPGLEPAPETSPGIEPGFEPEPEPETAPDPEPEPAQPPADQ